MKEFLYYTVVLGEVPEVIQKKKSEGVNGDILIFCLERLYHERRKISRKTSEEIPGLI